jgi:hypothetical protein
VGLILRLSQWLSDVELRCNNTIPTFAISWGVITPERADEA